MKEAVVNRTKRGVVASALVAGALVVALASGCAGASGQSSAQSAESSSAAAVSSVAAASDQASSSDQASASAASVEVQSVSAQAAEVQERAILEIGKATPKCNTMTIVNKTGGKIKNIAFSAAGSEDDPEYLMEKGQIWKKGEEALVHFEKLGKGANYDIHFKVKKNDYALHDLDLNDIKELEIRMEDGVAYAAFERDGSAISTLSDEVERAEAENAAAPEEEYYEEEVYYEDDSYYEEPAQQEDGCVDGGVQLR